MEASQVGVLMLGVLDMSGLLTYEGVLDWCELTPWVHQRAWSVDRSWAEDDIEAFIVGDVFCLGVCAAYKRSDGDNGPEQHWCSGSGRHD